VALNCVVPPAATCGMAGVTLIDASAMTFAVACVKLLMLLPAAAEHMSCAEYVPSVVSGPVEMEPEPDRLPSVDLNDPSLAEIEHCVGGYDSGYVVVAGPQVSVAAPGLVEVMMTVAGEGVSVTQGGTLFVGHSAFAGCIRKNRSMGKNKLASRPSMSPAGLGLPPGGAAPENADKLARTKASPEASEFIAQL
jgi:hypothetical protein